MSQKEPIKEIQSDRLEENTVTSLYHQAKTYLNQNKLDEAVQVCEQLLTLQPDFPAGCKITADVFLALGKLEEAQHWYTQTIHLQPNWAEAHVSLGNLYTELQKLETAKTCYQTALQIKPNCDQAYHKLGLVLSQLERWEEAVNTYKKAINLKPNYFWLHQRLGDALMQLERWDEAVDVYKQAIELKSDFCWSYNNLGDALRQLERWSEAVFSYRKAVELNPEFPWSYYNLGDVLAKLNHWDEAANAYQYAAKLQPDLPEIEDKIKNVTQKIQLNLALKNDSLSKLIHLSQELSELLKSPKPLVILYGMHDNGLCNKMMLLAHFIATAIEHDFWVMYPTFSASSSTRHNSQAYGQLFLGTANNPLCLFPPNEKLNAKFSDLQFNETLVDESVAYLKSLDRLPNEIYLQELAVGENFSINHLLPVIKNHKISFLSGFGYREEGLFNQYQDLIRKIFSPLPLHRYKANNIIKKARQNSNFVIGVHIRRGDYKNWKKGKYFLSCYHYSQIIKAILNFDPQLKISFIICSNDLDKKDVFEELNCYFSTGEVIEDLYCLSECDCIIGPPSTFSLWAAFYGKIPVEHITDLKLIRDLQTQFVAKSSLLNAFAKKVIEKTKNINL